MGYGVAVVVVVDGSNLPEEECVVVVVVGRVRRGVVVGRVVDGGEWWREVEEVSTVVDGGEVVEEGSVQRRCAVVVGTWCEVVEVVRCDDGGGCDEMGPFLDD